MTLRLLRAKEDDLDRVLDLQKIAFQSLLVKYKDYDTNPANETLEDLRRRYHQKGSSYYMIHKDTEVIGAIRLILKDRLMRISPMFILPSYQGRGLGQAVFDCLEEDFPQVNHYHLDTILQEDKLCYLYEKMGFVKNGKAFDIKENMTIVEYERVRS